MIVDYLIHRINTAATTHQIDRVLLPFLNNDAVMNELSARMNEINSNPVRRITPRAELN